MTGIVDAVRRTSAFIRPAPSWLVCRVRHGDDRISVGSSDDVSVVLNLSEAHLARCRMDGRTRVAEPFVGAVTLIPPGSPATFDLVGTASVLMMQLPWGEIGRAARDEGRDPDRFALAPRIAFDDPALARLLYAATVVPDAEAGVAGAVAAHLVAVHGVGPARSARVGGLPPTRLRRVCARIEDSLEEPPSLAELAAEAGLSLFHFARAFRRTTGLTPRRYVLRRQLDRAVTLLADRDSAVADVAAAAGFAHASHFARHLRRHTGLSPRAFRAGVLP